MKTACGKVCVHAFATAMAAILCLGIAGCGKSTAPEEAAKSAPAPAPIAAPVAKRQQAAPPAVLPASAADAARAAAVRAALAADSRLKSFAIDVRAENGSIELFGTVDSKASREKAEKLAAAIDGVNSVKNHLVLVSGS